MRKAVSFIHVTDSWKTNTSKPSKRLAMCHLLAFVVVKAGHKIVLQQDRIFVKTHIATYFLFNMHRKNSGSLNTNTLIGFLI